MRCSNCNADNQTGSNFCEDCGCRLPTACVSCGTPITQGKRFCRNCGTPVSGSIEFDKVDANKILAYQRVDSAPKNEPERRQLSIMFCDLVGSTALAERLDPEEMREIVNVYQKLTANIVSKFSGFVAKYMGDGILILYGYPVAGEDDPEQAVRTGLALIEQIPKASSDRQLAVRIGIATGLTVVGDLIGAGSSREQAVVGDTANLAARLQSIAEPNSLVISDSTRRLVGELFESRSLGPLKLKGISQPVSAFEVLKERYGAGRFEALRSSNTPFVGREEEGHHLKCKWSEARSRNGSLVLISGEAGIGKSRLAAFIEKSTCDDDRLLIRFDCTPHHVNSPFYPIITTINNSLGTRDGEAPTDARKRLIDFLEPSRCTVSEIQIMAELIGLPPINGEHPSAIAPAKKKEIIFDVFTRQIRGRAGSKTLLILWEDVHWADSASLEFVQLLSDQVPSLPLLLILTARPHFRPTWIDESHVHLITLNRLKREKVKEIVRYVAGHHLVSDTIISRIVEQTDGIPLFVEELTKSILEDSIQSKGIGDVPVTLYSVLQARLDRLDQAREVAQLASVVGREFSFGILIQLSGLSQATLEERLLRLEDSGLVRGKGDYPDRIFIFKHALVRDAAYEGLLKSQRAALHCKLGEIYEQYYPDVVMQKPDLLADHFAKANVFNKAINYRLSAANLALSRSASHEALQNVEDARTYIPMLDFRSAKKLSLKLAVVSVEALRMSKGFCSPETGSALAEARALLDHDAEESDRVTVSSNLWSFNFVVGRPRLAYKMSRNLIDPTLADSAVLRDYMEGASCLNIGTFKRSVLKLEYVLKSLKNIDYKYPYAFGYHILPTTHAWLSLSYLMLGRLAEAQHAAEEATAIAIQINHPFTMVHVRNILTYHAFHLGNLREAAGLNAACAEIAQQNGFHYYEIRTRILKNICECMEYPDSKSIEAIYRDLHYEEQLGILNRHSVIRGALATILLKIGCVREALDVINSAITNPIFREHGYMMPDLYRLMAEITLIDDPANRSPALIWYQKGLKWAERQGATFLLRQFSQIRTKLDNNSMSV